MDIMNFLSGINWDFIKNRLLNMGVDASKLNGIDFTNVNDLNKLAEDIMPGIIKANPKIADIIKQNSAMLSKEKQEEVVQVIDAA